MPRKKTAPVPDLSPEEKFRQHQKTLHRARYETLMAGDVREVWTWLVILQEPFRKDEPKEDLVHRLMPLLIGPKNYTELLAVLAAEPAPQAPEPEPRKQPKARKERAYAR